MNQNDHWSFCLAETHGLARKGEPVTLGVPMPDGPAGDQAWIVETESGQRLGSKCVVLSRWPSGAPRWLAVTMLVDMEAHGHTKGRVVTVDQRRQDGLAGGVGSECIVADETAEELCTLQTQSGAENVAATVALRGERLSGEIVTPTHRSVHAYKDHGVAGAEIAGLIGKRSPIRFRAALDGFERQGLFRIELTLQNPRRAEHPGGMWDLGDPHSERMRSLSLIIRTDFPPDRQVIWCEQPDGVQLSANALQWRLVQTASGGPNFRSRVHIDADGRIPIAANGYALKCGDQQRVGTRALPIVGLSAGERQVAVTMVDFWQKFPSAIEVNGSEVAVHLFPELDGWCHELQPGEQTTRVVWLRLASRANALSHLGFVHRPVVAVPLVGELAATHALEWVPADDLTGECAIRPGRSVASATSTENHLPNATANTGSDDGATQTERGYLDALLDGPRNFFWKREQIDEYGWRNYGDVWADHEAVYADAEPPVISHYNNQYDLLHSLLRLFIVTRERQWWELAQPLAEHLIDIDIYNTSRDRAAINGGLFWHTGHYLDAGRCTHRSFSADARGKKYATDGGGPSCEHDYTSGLLLYYHLTGSPHAKAALLRLADWVVAMDDGRRDILAPLSRARTGKASSTSTIDYHGPGRGAGNSISALVDAWQATRDDQYLEKCHEIIRRVVHPNDDIDRYDLRNAELRWSYTVCLQALLRYDTIVGNAEPAMRRYVRAALVRYGRWMVQNERLYLDDPEQLEFPTETWAAQDLRKGTVMLLIAQYLGGAEQQTMVTRGRELYAAAWKQLMRCPTKDFTRPAAIACQQLVIMQWLRSEDAVVANTSSLCDWDSLSWPPKETFQTQKAEIRSRLRSFAGMCQLSLLALRPKPWLKTIPATPLGRALRRWSN